MSMTSEIPHERNKASSYETKSPSKDAVAETNHIASGSEIRIPKDTDIIDGSSELKSDISGDASTTASKPPVKQSSSLGHQPSSSSHPSQAQGLQVKLPASDDVPTASVSGKDPPEISSAARVAPHVLNTAERALPYADAVASGLSSRISSLSAAARASLRDMIASSAVFSGGSGAARAEDDAAGGASGSSGTMGNGSLPPGKGMTDAVFTEPAARSGAAETITGDSAHIGVNEPSVKPDPPDSPATAPVEAKVEYVPGAPLQKHESGAFTPSTGSSYPETERQGHPTSALAANTPGSSTVSDRGVKLAKEEPPASSRRSSSYLYNDWDRTLYEKTGRPPPGAAHWSRESSAQRQRSPNHPDRAGMSQHSQTSARAAPRSASARRQRSHSRPASSTGRRRMFDMGRCRRETQDQFGRRILYRHCFIEPEFTLRGQRIPVHGARKGSIIAAEDTYAGYTIALVMPPAESQLSAQKVQRRMRAGKKRRKKRRRRSSNGLNAKREWLLIEDHWQRLEEENEKLEEDRIRLQETHQHLQQMEAWWQTEGLLILQRDELRAQEEGIINAVIEEECRRINDERARIRQEWQFLVERIERQEREESRIKEEIDALQERQEELTEREDLDTRRTNQMKAAFEIERHMMQVNRKKLVDDALTCNTFRNALGDADLGGWESMSSEAHSRTRGNSADREEPARVEVGDPFANIKDSRLERLLADVIRPQPAPESSQSPPASAAAKPVSSPPTPGSHEQQQRSPAPDEAEGCHLQSVDGDSPRSLPPRPVTARGRPVRATRSAPSGGSMAHQAGRPLSATRSEGTGSMVPATETPGNGSYETIDIWRRRPTVIERGEVSSVVIVTDKHPPDGSRRGSSLQVPSTELTMPGATAQGAVVRATPAVGREHAKSGGYLNPNVKRAEAESARRRASTTPHLETQAKSMANTIAANTVSATAGTSERAAAERTASRDAAPIPLETAAAKHETSPQIPQPKTGDDAETAADDSDMGLSPGSVGGIPQAESQPSALRSGGRSGEASRRHVSFHEEAVVQPLDEGVSGGSAAQDVNDAEAEGEAAERRPETASADGGSVVRKLEADVSDVPGADATLSR